MHKPQVYPTGLCKWSLPNELSILWFGPNCGLLLCSNKPGGFMTDIQSTGSNGKYATRKDAQRAVETFLANAATQ